MSLRFPQDLIQAGDAKCSLDALLLAAFVEGAHERVVDLGAGCGVVGLGLLLRDAAGSVAGLEKDEAQLEAARQNARLFGLEHRYTACAADFAMDGSAGTGAKQADLVVCNPPWRLERAERPPVSARRRAALYGTEQTLALFARAGASRLRRGGRYVSVAGAERLADMMHALTGAGLCPTRLRLAHPRPGRAAAFALLEARCQVKGRLRVEPPLILHEAGGYSGQAREFCCWL
ncbi:MAG: methyltransferase [Deltaproteobacteria bacterium]|jgi:tRNA1(Val) A37 N6-methylase TrmN6|nr:methyltransferase [Deltaproteobacteria bacterium]